ncbi:MAG: M56 family metallopeptidase [Planctomycetota bacterium]|jgi:beta-lactamase regulating signal transducer with metallopeptidase domain
MINYGFADFALQSTILLTVATLVELLAAKLRVAPARRHLILFVACIGLLLLPFVNWLLPQSPRPLIQPRPGQPVLTMQSSPEELPAATIPLQAQPGPWDLEGVNLLLIVWGLGVLLLLAVISLQFTLSRYLAARATRTQNGNLRAQFRRLSLSMGIERTGLLASARIQSPICLGLIRRRILVPTDFASWPESKREAALRHELAHARRRDELANIIIHLARAVCWLNPMAWWIVARSTDLREMACDDAVVGQGCDPLEYAERLLDIAREHSGLLPLPGLGMGKPGGSLRRRLRALISPNRDRRAANPAWALACAAGMCASIAALPGFSFEQDKAALLAACNSADPTERRSALLALARQPESQWFAEVVPLAKDKDPEVRAAAVWALSRIGCNPAFLTATSLLDDPSPRVRGVAARSLFSFRRSLFNWPRDQLLRTQRRFYQEHLPRWIGRPGSETGLSLLRASTHDDSPWVAEAARVLLERVEARL